MARTLEAKFPFPAGREAAIAAILGATCLPDPRHRADTVNSLYFDSCARRHLDEKLDSEYEKAKIRVRWYGQSSSDLSGVAAFVEVKAKHGVVRDKRRIEVRLDPDWLRPGREDLAAIARAAAPAICELRPGECDLVPAIVIRYVRQRYLLPAAQARIALDSGIGYSAVNGAVFRPAPPRTLRYGVLEVKSPTGRLPGPLWALSAHVFQRDSFSKYEESWRIHADPVSSRGFRWMLFGR